MTCRCPNVYAGMHETDSKNWNPYCQEHGLESDWYNSEQEKKKREIQQEITIGLQKVARLRRKGEITQEEGINMVADLYKPYLPK